MKKDWTYKKLGEACNILNGYAFKSNRYVDKGIRVIRIANVQKGVIVDEQPAFYPLSTQSEIDKYILNEGDILMSLTGNVGRVGILQKEMLPAALNQRVACLRMIDNSLSQKFFFHYLNSDSFEQKCIASARGIAQLNMSTEWLKEQIIPIPPLSIQRSIVAELDLLHSVISKKKEQLRELDNFAQSLFYQMFGDPITNPMGWEIKKLGEVAETYRGLTYSKKDETNVSSKKVLRSNNIDLLTHSLDLEDIKYLRDDFIIPEDKKIKKDSIFICMSNGSMQHLGKVAYIDKDYDYAFGGFMGLIVPRKSVSARFVYYNLLLPAFLQTVLKEGRGANINNLKFSDIENFPIILPPLSLQQSFAAKISAIEAQKQAITLSIKETEALLAQRMDRYFS